MVVGKEGSSVAVGKEVGGGGMAVGVDGCAVALAVGRAVGVGGMAVDVDARFVAVAAGGRPGVGEARDDVTRVPEVDMGF
jgi:hypothetical protein